MRKKSGLLVSGLLVAALLVFSGCDDFSSPKAVVGTSYKAVHKNDLKLFKATLSSDALAKFGNAQGLRELATRFEGQAVAVDKIEQISSERDVRGWTTSRTYHVEITGRPTSTPNSAPVHLLDATVLCSIEYIYKERWDGYPPYGHPGDDWRYPRPDYDCRAGHEGYYGYCHFDEYVTCTISQLLN